MLKISKIFFVMVSFFCLLGLLAPSLLQAETIYPERAIKIVVPFKPGGLSDTSGRIIAKFLSDHFGKPVVVTNIAGAAGTVGSRSVLKSKPDGYTLLWHHEAMLVSNVIGVADFNWDDFTLICKALRTHSVMVVRADSPWKTIKDLVDDARKRPNAIKYGSNPGGLSYFMTLEVVKSTKAKYRIVGGGGDAIRIQQLLGGHIDCAAPGVSAVLPHIQAGKLRPLGIIAEERIPGIDIPTLREQGVDATISIDLMLFAAKGTPEAVVETLSSAMKTMMKDAEIMEKFRKMGFFPGYLDQKAATDYMRALTKTYIQLGKEAPRLWKVKK